MDLSQKKYLVTGASSGIGRAAAIMISKLGGNVVLNGRNKERLDQTLSMMNGEGHYSMPFDLLRFNETGRYIRECIEKDARRFDGLVFSTGIGGARAIRSMNSEHFQRLMDTNCTSYVALLTEFSSRRVLNNSGSIVAVSSSITKHYDKSSLSYAGSKAALEAVSTVAARELVSRGIRVNTVLPEVTITPLTTGFSDRTTETQRKEWYPLGVLTPEDVANTIVFLLSDMSSKLTGQHIYLSSGNDGRPIDHIL